MFLALLRKLFFTMIILVVLSVISYSILLRDPLHPVDGGGVSGYVAYVQGLLQGHLGSGYHGEPLREQILTVFPSTLLLCTSAMCLSLLAGIPLGFFAVTQRENLLGKLLISLGSLSLCVPVFWLAIICSAYAGENGWHISPMTLAEQAPFVGGEMAYWVNELLLPTFILAIPATLEMMRVTHQRAEYVLTQNYVKVARARGWSPCQVWRDLVLRNTLPALVPMTAHTFTLIFAFGMLIENVVSWSGIGRWLIVALSEQDYQAISAAVVAIGVFVLFVDLLAGAFRTLLDPYQKKDWFDVK